MSTDGSISESLVLADSGEGVIIRGITDDKIAAKSGLRAGDEIVAATVHLGHLNKEEVLSILKVLEPYDENLTVLTKKEMDASAGLGSLGLGLQTPSELFNLKNKGVSVDGSAEVPAGSLNGPSINAEPRFSVPTLNGDLPNLSLHKPSADTGANLSLPSLGLTGPDVNRGLDGSVEAPNVNFSTPRLSAPSASVNVEKPDLKKGKLKYDPPKFTMPNFNLPKAKTPTAEADISGDVDVPKLDLDADPELSTGKKIWPWKKPNFHLPRSDANLDAPDVDVSVPKVEGGINGPASLPGVDVKGPNVQGGLPDLDMKTPNVEASKFHWDDLKWWKHKSPKGNLDMDTGVNTPNFNLSAPKIEGDLNGPNVNVDKPDIDIDPPSGKMTWPHHKWNKLKGPKADMDLNADVGTPSVGLSAPGIDGDASIPNADLEVKPPDANIDSKLRFPTLKKPKFMLSGNAKGPELDVDAPKVDANADIDAPTRRFKWLDFRKPKGSLSGPNINGPDLDLDADVSGPDLSLSGPKIDADINAPKADLKGPKLDVNAPDVKGPSGWKLKGFHFPKFGTLKAPKADLDADLNAPKIKGGIDAPDVKVNAPDVEGPSEPTFKGFPFPKFGTLKAPKADLDADLNAPKIEGGIDAPDVNVSMPNADVKVPNVDLDSPDGKVKFSKLKFPKFKGSKVKSPELDAPDIDASFDVPKADVKYPDFSLSAPKIEGGVDADLEKDISGAFKLPTFKLGGSKAKLPEAEIKGPDLPDANIQLPSADVNAPSINASAPTIKGDLSSPNLKLGSGLNPDLKFKAPKSNISLPDLDMSLPNAAVKGPSVDLPKADLKGPDGQVKAPDLDFDSSLGDFSLPHFQLPKLGLSDPKVEGPSVKSGVQSPQVNLTTPSADADISVPAVSLSAPKVEGDISGPKVDVKTPDVDANLEKPKFPYFSLPKLNFPGSKVKSPELDTNANLDVPSVEGGISSPDVKVSGPEGGITADTDARVKGSKLKWPFSLGRKSGTDEEGSDVESEITVPKADGEVPAFKTHKLPRNSIDGVDEIGDTFNLSKIDNNAKDYLYSKGVCLPILNPASKPAGKIDIMERLKMSKEKLPSANASPTEAKSNIDLKLSAPSVHVNGSSEDSSLVRGGTFKVEKPAIAVSSSDENDRLSQGLSNMLGLN